MQRCAIRSSPERRTFFGPRPEYFHRDEEFSHVSSSLIKQITPLAGDDELARFVPRAIIGDLRAKLNE
jgi:phosphopantetheine adenylyltransferase